MIEGGIFYAKKQKDKYFFSVATALLTWITLFLREICHLHPLFGFPSVRFFFIAFRYFWRALYFGGSLGIIGIVSDIIAFFWQAAAVSSRFTLNLMLTGLLPGLVFTVVRKRRIFLFF
jgi:hypothetical protein